MDGVGLLREADLAGLQVLLRGDTLVVRGPRHADAVARQLLDHKPDVIQALRRNALREAVPKDTVPVFGIPSDQPFLTITPEDLPWDWRIEWLERAAIREIDGGQAREHAEAEALREVVQRMRATGGVPDREGWV